MISLISGKYKGKKLYHFSNIYVRPTQAKIRKSILKKSILKKPGLLITLAGQTRQNYAVNKTIIVACIIHVVTTIW